MTKEKKQYIILGALVVVVLAVGGFQLLGGSGGGGDTTVVIEDEDDTPDVVATPAPELTNEEQEAVNSQLISIIAAETTPRDPFVPLAVSRQGGGGEQPVAITGERAIAANASRPGGGSSAPRTPYVPPMPPLGGDFPGIQAVPNGDQGLPGAGSDYTIAAAGPDYKVKGVIVGENRKMAVFEDSAGNQKLVPVGGSVDGEMKVTNIERGEVTVQKGDQAKILGLSEEDDR